MVQRAGLAALKEGERFVRWCFAASEDRLAEGVQRLRSMLVRNRASAH
jgi:aspartate/methionine/tyrosine aminotransferase